MKYILGIGIILFLISCTQQEVCEEDPGSEMVVRFKSLKEDIPVDTIVEGISVFGIREGLEDSLLYDSQSASRIVLPLNPATEQSGFVLTAGSGTDTLRIFHGNSYYMISYSCGFGTRFSITSLSHSGNLIREMEVIRSDVDAEMEDDEEHIWIYL